MSEWWQQQSKRTLEVDVRIRPAAEFVSLTQRLSDQKRLDQTMREALAGTHQTTDLLLEFMPDVLMLMCDLRLRVQWVGGSGWVIDRDAIVGKSLEDAFGHEVAAELRPLYTQALSKDTTFETSFGGKMWTSYARPLRDSSGTVIGMLLASRPAAQGGRRSGGEHVAAAEPGPGSAVG